MDLAASPSPPERLKRAGIRGAELTTTDLHGWILIGWFIIINFFSKVLNRAKQS